MTQNLDRPMNPSQTSGGAVAESDAHSLSVGPNGPLVLHDVHLVETLAHFNRENIVERRPHAKGAGAFGTFTVTHDVSAYTKAAVFQPGTQTKTLIRFSTVAGELGSPDTWRDVRGFSLRFYTTEGNYDLVGNNTPVFFLRDPLKFPDLNHAVKRDPRTNLRSARNNWDFWTLLPEALHQVTVVMSDRGIPASYRHMHGFGSHTFSFINAQNERFWVKFHFKTQQGIKNWTDEEAAAAVALDRSTPLLKGQSRAVFPSSRVSAASPRARTLNSGRLAQPCFWHFGGQRALDHLLGWEREGSTNCTLET